MSSGLARFTLPGYAICQHKRSDWGVDSVHSQRTRTPTDCGECSSSGAIETVSRVARCVTIQRLTTSLLRKRLWVAWVFRMISAARSHLYSLKKTDGWMPRIENLWRSVSLIQTNRNKRKITMLNLENKVIAITGASSGIGEATAIITCWN